MTNHADRCRWLRLEAIVRDRNAPQNHAWRAEIVLLSADRLSTVEAMHRTGKSEVIDKVIALT